MAKAFRSVKLPNPPKIELGKKNKNGLCPVRIRISYLRQRMELPSGVSVVPSKWDNVSRKVIDKTTNNGYTSAYLNDTINFRLGIINKFFRDKVDSKTPIVLAELKNYYYQQINSLNSNNQNDTSFFSLIRQYIDNQNKTRGWSKSYWQQWCNLVLKLSNFKENFDFEDLNAKQMNDFVDFQTATLANDKIKENLKKLREFCGWAKGLNYDIPVEFFNYKPILTSRDNEVKFLNSEEIEKIYKLDLSKFPTLEKVRDEFVFQCFTSLRYSDLSSLVRDNFKEGADGIVELRLITKKKKKSVWFPLPNVAKAIYLKYKKQKYPGAKAFDVLPNNKYNLYLKKLGGKDFANISGQVVHSHYVKKKEIVEKIPRAAICSHDARRSFIVYALNNNISPEIVSLFTSHSEVKEMAPYTTLSETGKEKLTDLFNKMF